jgi:hypothetical protein
MSKAMSLGALGMLALGMAAMVQGEGNSMYHLVALVAVVASALMFRRGIEP